MNSRTMERKRIIPGAGGLGKVTVIMKPRKKRSKLRPLIALIIYPIFFSLIFLSFAWSRPNLKYNYALPALRGLINAFGIVKKLRYVQPAPVELNDQNFTMVVSDSLLGALREQGRIHAMERLYQMDVDRRTALGTLSAVFGQNTLYLDKWARTLNFEQLAVSDFEALPDSTKAQLNSYADGVNDYLREYTTESLPLDFDLTYGPWAAVGYPPAPEHDITSIAPWTAIHSLAILRMTLYASSRGWEDDILTFVAKKVDRLVRKPVSRILDEPASESSSSSSPWRPEAIPSLGGTAIAISASASASGSAILAHNHYASPQGQRFWYRNCLVHGTHQACGLSLPGLPWLLHGRTASHSWALLADPRGEAEQLFTGMPSPSSHPSSPLSHRTEEIAVHGEANVSFSIHSLSPDNDVFIEDLLATSTRRVANVGRVALRSNFLAHRLSPDVFVRLLSEDDIPADFSLAGLPFQLVYATRQGGIGHVLSQVPPVSTQPAQAMQVLPRVAGGPASLAPLPPSLREGRSEATVWIAASVDLLTAVEDLRGQAEDCAHFALCRLVQRLEDGARVAVEDVQAVLHDDFSPSGYLLHRLVRETWPLPHALLSPVPFTGQYTADSLEASRVEALRTYLLDNLYVVSSLLRDGMVTEDARDTFPALSHRSLNSHYATLLCGQNLTAIRRLSVLRHRTQGVLTLLRESVSEGREQVYQNASDAVEAFLHEHFPLDSAWGQVHSALYPHALEPVVEMVDTVLSRGPIKAHGGLDSVWLTEYSGTVGGHDLSRREALQSHRHDLLTAFSSLAVMQAPVQTFSATGFGLESTQSSRWTDGEARLHRGVWTTVQQVLDTVAGWYRPSKSSSSPPAEL